MRVVNVFERLRSRLGALHADTRSPSHGVACAVLVPLVPVGDDFEVLYTVRSSDLPSHGGQVAFPGGKHTADVDQRLMDTALREAHEEIGLAPSAVSVLGSLETVATLSGDFAITPYVGVVASGASLRPNPGEVSAIFTVPCAELADPRRRASERRRWRGQDFDVDVIRAGRRTIWGATHRITLDLLGRLTKKE